MKVSTLMNIYVHEITDGKWELKFSNCALVLVTDGCRIVDLQ